MKIAITTDQDFVSSCFGCCPACTLYDVEAGKIRNTFVVPNPCWSHREWADFLERNAVSCLIVGNIGTNARAVLRWRGIRVISGVEGPVSEVIDHYLTGSLRFGDTDCAGRGRGQPAPGGDLTKTP